MSLLPPIYLLAGAFGLSLSLIHFLIWLRNRNQSEFLLASTMAFAAAVSALIEWQLLSSKTVESYQSLVSWQNLWVGVLLIAMVWYVRLRLGTGRLWLAWAITASWSACVVVNFLTEGNLSFASIETIGTAQTFWGESFTVVRGQAHPFKVVADLTSLIILIYVLDASISAYRAGHRHRAVLTGGSILFFIMAAGIHTPLVDAGIVQTPFMISLAFVAVTIALAIDLVDEVARSSAQNLQLEGQRRRWNTLVERVELAVARVDRSGKIAYVNPFLRKITGKSEKELIGQPFASMLAQDTSTANSPEFNVAQPESVRSRVSRPLATHDGGVRDVVWFAVETQDENAQYDGFITFGEDRTEQIRTRDELSRLKTGMDKLTKAVLLGEMASSFAHELNQPIAAVLSNAQSLEIMRARAERPKDETDEVLADIINDTRRARDLMDRVRGFMFNESPVLEQFDFLNALDEVEQMLQHDLASREVALYVDSNAEEICVEGVRLELQQVLLNLILNAAQAIENSECANRDVRLEVRERADALVVAVEDEGPGIDPSIRDQILEPFVSFKAKGTGIGLAVVRRIVERHEGRIEIQDSEAGGARVQISLPILAHRVEAAIA